MTQQLLPLLQQELFAISNVKSDHSRQMRGRSAEPSQKSPAHLPEHLVAAETLSQTPQAPVLLLRLPLLLLSLEAGDGEWHQIDLKGI